MTLSESIAEIIKRAVPDRATHGRLVVVPRADLEKLLALAAEGKKQ